MRTLLATDFDGTIAPIVNDPDAAAMHPAARALLAGIDDPAVTVAVVSGRDVADVRARIAGVRAIVAGAHGLECEDADGRALWTSPRAFPAPPPDLAAALESAELRIERKKYSMAVHFRGLDPTPALDALLASFDAWARGEDLVVIHGRKVVEARVPGGGKEVALRALAERAGADRVIYAGDDTTDLAALAFAAAHGRAAFVVSPERAAPDDPAIARVHGIEELCAFFERELRQPAI